MSGTVTADRPCAQGSVKTSKSYNDLIQHSQSKSGIISEAEFI